MKKSIAGALSLLGFTGHLLLSPLTAAAATRPPDLATLQTCITLINEEARLSLNTQLAAKKRLADNYDLTFGRIDGLLGLNLSYGELAAVLAFAEKMHGGVRDANIDRIVKLRQSGLGWDQIADNLALDLSGITAALSRFEDGIHSSVKQTLVESGSNVGGMDGTDKSPTSP